jgi:hypothetical protein
VTIILSVVGIWAFLCLLAWALPDPYNRRYSRELKSRFPSPRYIKAGSPTTLTLRDGKVYDADGNEVKTYPLKELLNKKAS